MAKVFIVGTCDTKSEELWYLKSILVHQGLEALIVDVGTQKHELPADISNATVNSYQPDGINVLDMNDRGGAITAMSEALKHFLLEADDCKGVIGIGGSGGTSLISHAMKALRLGIPKIMVSTVASGNTRPYVGASDILMMYSVADLAGLNSITRLVLDNAANALAGMVKGSSNPGQESADKPLLGLTMFGVTTPCVMHIRQHFKDEFDCVAFHATGIGGMSFEKLVYSGLMHHVIDVTLTEICDLMMGGIMSAGESRLDAFIQQALPYVGSVGALDMVNFGDMESVPAGYRSRLLYRHNAQVTLMRTTPQENVAMGKWIAQKLNQMPGPVRFLLPEKGVSLLDMPGKPFYDPEADQALFATIKEHFLVSGNHQLHLLPYAVNDVEFAEALIHSFEEINRK